MIYKNGIESADIKKGIIVAVCSLLINIVVILLIGPNGKDFIEKIFLTLASEPYHWLYLIMLLISGISVVKKNEISFWLTSILLGIIAPAIIAAIVYAIFVVIAIIFLLLFGGSKGSSASRFYSSNTQSSNNNSSPSRRSDDTVDKKSSNAISKEEEKRRRDREIDFLTTGWTYGTARFKGKSPSRCLDRGGVMIWYNGELNQKTSIGTTEVYEATGDICVVFPKNYRGRDIQFYSTNGIVQIQSL